MKYKNNRCPICLTECGKTDMQGLITCVVCGYKGQACGGCKPMDTLIDQLAEARKLPAAQPFTLRQLQEEQAPWVAHNFPGREPFYPLLGAVEELGELCHAHLKSLQGIRGTSEQHHADKIDAVADAIIFISDYCTANNIDLQSAVEETWAKVKLRDWKADPKNGNPKEQA